MIIFQDVRGLSPIFLSVLAILFLIIYELGNEKIKKIFLPFIIVLIVIFVIIAGIDIYNMYIK